MDILRRRVAPIAASAILLAPILHDRILPKNVPLDVVGLLSLVAALSSLLYVLVEGERWDWFDDSLNVAAALVATVGFVVFVVWELRTPHPLVDLRVLKRGNVAAGSFLAGVFGFGLYGLFLIEPYSTQLTIGLTATLSGVLVMLQNLVGTAIMPPVSRLMARGVVSPRVVLGAGFGLMGIGCLMTAGVTTTATDFSTLVLPFLLTGVGIMLVMTPLPSIVIGGLHGPAEVTTAASFFNVVRILGGSVGIAMIQNVADIRFAFHQSALASTVTLARPSVASPPLPHALSPRAARFAGYRGEQRSCPVRRLPNRLAHRVPVAARHPFTAPSED